MTKVDQILFKVFFDRVNRFNYHNSRLVHYTSSKNAFSILKNKEFWMGLARNMPDSSEIMWGYDLVKTSFTHLNERSENVFKKLLGNEYHQFMWWLFNIQSSLNETYVLCFAEHMLEEVNSGVLPMWRSYGKDDYPVTLNFNVNLYQPIGSLPYITPVEYLDRSEFNLKFAELVNNFEIEFKELKKENNLFLKLQHMVVAAIVSLKHPSYSSEKEWRMIVNQSFYNFDGITRGINALGGHPKQIIKFSLRQKVDSHGKSALDLLESITLGPSNKQNIIKNSFEQFFCDIDLLHCNIKCSDLPERLDY